MIRITLMNQVLENKLEDFFQGYSLKKYRKGQPIIWAGDEPPGVIYLVTGSVGQYDISENGQKIMLNIFKPPAFFPMSWAINKTKNKYFYEALDDIKCHIAPSDDAVKFLRLNPDLIFDLLSRVYRGTDGLLERMAELMAGTARSQLLLEILISTYRFGEIKRDGSAELSVKVIHLAQRTGMARETVSRELKKLEAEKVIERHKDVIKISDINTIHKK